MKNLLIAFCLFHLSLIAKEYDNVFILSYPGSGSHLTMYGLTHLFDTTWESPYKEGYFKNSRFKRFNRYFHRTYNHNRTGIYRIHEPSDFKLFRNEIAKQNNALILIIRDYKDCFYHQYANGMDLSNSPHRILAKKGPIFIDKQYFENLIFFEHFKGNKLLIEYDMLISDPRTYFRVICEFLKENNCSLDQFIDELPQHKQKILQFYSKHIGTSVLQNKTKNKKLLSKEFWKPLNQCIHKQYPDLFEKYLKKYSE